MRQDSVIVDTSLLDQDLRLHQFVEDFAVEQLVEEGGVGAFVVSILSG